MQALLWTNAEPVKPAPHFSTRELCLIGVAGAASFVLGLVSLPTPFAPFLRYNPADVPPILVAFGLGQGAGLMTVVVRVLLKLMTNTADPVGLAMNLVASGTFVAIVGAVGRHPARPAARLLSLALGTAAMTAVMLPINYFVLEAGGYVPKGQVLECLCLAITPFNLVKGLTNSLLALMLWRRLAPGLKPLD